MKNRMVVTAGIVVESWSIPAGHTLGNRGLRAKRWPFCIVLGVEAGQENWEEIGGVQWGLGWSLQGVELKSREDFIFQP